MIEIKDTVLQKYIGNLPLFYIIISFSCIQSIFIYNRRNKNKIFKRRFKTNEEVSSCLIGIKGK